MRAVDLFVGCVYRDLLLFYNNLHLLFGSGPGAALFTWPIYYQPPQVLRYRSTPRFNSVNVFFSVTSPVPGGGAFAISGLNFGPSSSYLNYHLLVVLSCFLTFFVIFFVCCMFLVCVFFFILGVFKFFKNIFIIFLIYLTDCLQICKKCYIWRCFGFLF